MIKRTFSLLSEEFTALIWTMSQIEKETGSRPSTNKAVGAAISAFAASKGYQVVNSKEISNGTDSDK